MAETLFDPSPYTTAGGRKPSRQVVPSEVTLEPVGEGWTLVVTRRGVSQHQHAIKATDPLYAAARMQCNLVGRQFTPEAGQEHLWVAERCPTCVREVEGE